MKIISTATIASTPWLRFAERRYLDREGREKGWTYVERLGEKPAVLIIARTEKSGRVVLVRQYRVPLDCYALEFPAGLADAGESIEETARRELLEETGFEGRITSIGPALCSSPGLTNELVSIVTMEVAEEPARAASPEASEEIKVLTPSLDELGVLIQGASAARVIIDSRLYGWWLGQRP